MKLISVPPEKKDRKILGSKESVQDLRTSLEKKTEKTFEKFEKSKRVAIEKAHKRFLD